MSDLESLRNPADFRRVLSKGKRHREQGFSVLRSPGRQGPPRLGLVVSKRSGNAVGRNRIKRRLRHAIAAIELQPGNDYVIIVNDQASTAPFSELTETLRRAVEALDA